MDYITSMKQQTESCDEHGSIFFPFLAGKKFDTEYVALVLPLCGNENKFENKFENKLAKHLALHRKTWYNNKTLSDRR